MTSLMRICAALLLAFLAGHAAIAADVSVALPPGTAIPDVAQPGPAFDAAAATDAYLALLTPEQRARSDAYYEGGYWLQLWNWLAGVGAALLILTLGWAVRIRDWAQRRTASPFLQTFLFTIAFIALLWALTLPLSIYAGFFREHQYGSSNQTFIEWLVDDLKGLGFTLLGLGLLVGAIYALVRRSSGGWWAWATGVTFLFMLLINVLAPVFLNPAFNDYKPLPPGEARDAILSIARASQIPATEVKWFDASKQTKRISAHVSGMFGTTEIALNDNLLEQTSLAEIKAVMGHEMGHYVLNHGMRLSVYLTLILGVGFFVLDRSIGVALARYGSRWRISSRGDPATLPLVFAIFSTYMLLATPWWNQTIMGAEKEADLYGLNAAREPHGFATVAMRLGSYRKLEPGPIEKWFFYDHPSGRDRVEMSMQWLRENQALFTPAAPATTAAPE